MKNKKLAVLKSFLAMLLCVAMLIGNTFAWFTDGVSSGENVIVSGNLDLQMYWTDDPESGVWYDVEDALYNTIFSYDNWEPGYTEVRYIKLVNSGSLALNYSLALTPQTEVGKLAEVVNVYFANSQVAMNSRQDLEQLQAIGLLNNVMNGGATATGTLLPAGQVGLHPAGEVVMTFAMSMVTTAGNEYQGEETGDFTITALATQCAYESDSFGADYDGTSEYPGNYTGGTISMNIAAVDNKIPTGGVTMAGSGISAFVPEGTTVEAGTDKLTLTVTPLSDSSSNITVVNEEVLIPVDVHIQGIAPDNTKPIVIDMGAVLPKYLNMGNYHLYHVENGTNAEMTLVSSRDELTAHNTFTYDPYTGNVTVAMASFSEVALVADTAAPWSGSANYDWYNEEAIANKTFEIINADQLYAFAKIVGGMAEDREADSFEGATVKLISDINLNGGKVKDENDKTKIFYPIGYYNNTDEKVYDREDAEVVGMAGVDSSVSAFEGTFDGNGHTISDFYQNTWEMFGDYNNGYTGTPNYYKDAMGLFGYVFNGTVKNLTVNNFESDGEFTPTGVIAAYAAGNSTFENIAITNCNPRVYNTGNGGIIGVAGRENDAVESITLRNITVDKTNKISALWGSYDVACGGLVGMYRGNATATGAATGDTISFENCHVAAQMDVYNDVCGNYQYYAYRYAGMIIGSVRHNIKNGEGKTIPNMAGISASDCTVNFGTWNDYYYCEFEKNSQASYTEDFQFSRVDKSEILFDAAGNVTGCTHDHSEAEDKTAVYLPFHQLFTGYSWGVSSIGLKEYSGIVTDLDIIEGDQNESVEKFETKFTGDFLYRVGNSGTVSLGTLFAEKELLDSKGNPITVNDSGVWVTVEKFNADMAVSGTFTKSTTGNWENGKIQFSGTGLVKLTIQDYNYCKPTELILEVVDAVNATSATSAKSNNVVLLKDCGFSSLEVSGGYTLYGNGFTLTCNSDSPALDMGYAFVTLNNGTLDNVQIVCPNYDHAVLYKSNMTESGNRSETTDGKTRYYNVKSGVMTYGNSQILNSRISGARAAVNVAGGNLVIDNSRVELGAVASILVGAANELTLRNVTLVQKPTASTFDSSKKLMGFSVLVVCDADGNSPGIRLEGKLVQNAWVNETDKQYVPSAGQSIVSTVMEKTDYIHSIDGVDSLNLGIAYMPESLSSKVNTATIEDERSNKQAVPYDYAEVAILNGNTYVYSYKSSNGTEDEIAEEKPYTPDAYGDIIAVSYADTADGLTVGKTYGANGWVYELNVDLDKLAGYAVDFSKLTVTINGVSATDFKVNGSEKPAAPVAVVAGGTDYVLTATVGDKVYNINYKVTGTETSKESPSLVASNYEAGLCVASSYGGTWHGAAPALEGIQIKYWSVAEKQYKTIVLSDYTPTTAGKQNGSNTTWTYSPDNGDFTLTLTGGQVHSSNKVYAMPVVCDGKLYFVAASSNGLVNSGNSARTIPVSYSFKDNNNGDVLNFSHTWSVAENKDAQYKYSDFCNGTLTKLEASSGGGCVTPDTLITLADGQQVRVDQLKGDELLLTWNLETGKYEAAPIVFVDSEEETEYEIIHLYFSDGSDVKVISEHGFFDLDLGKYVYIDANNYADFVGHRFVALGDERADRWNVVTLDQVIIEKEVTTAWSPVTFRNLCYYTNGVLSMPGGIEGLFNIFEVNTATMRYDQEQKQADIEQFGLFTIDDFGGMITQEAFDAFNGAYLKVALAKGLLTWEDIAEMAERYIPLM